MNSRSPKQLCAVVAESLSDARDLYADLLLDLAEYAADPGAEGFLEAVRGTGLDVGLFLLALARSIEQAAGESHDELLREAAGLLRSARPLIDSLVLLTTASTREELFALPLASGDEVDAVLTSAKASAWIAAHRGS